MAYFGRQALCLSLLYVANYTRILFLSFLSQNLGKLPLITIIFTIRQYVQNFATIILQYSLKIIFAQLCHKIAINSAYL